MSDYFYLEDSESDMGMTPVPSEEMVGAIREIARKEGVEITDQQILEEVYGNEMEKDKTRDKTNLYIDGTNLLAGLVEIFGYDRVPPFVSIIKTIGKYYKIDHIYFYASFTPRKNVRKTNVKKQILLEKKFFDQVKNLKQVIFYKGYRSPASKKEKGVDVHLAVDIIKHAFLGEYQRAVIFTGDADLAYPVEVVRQLKLPIFALFLPNRFSLAIAYQALSSIILDYKGVFKKFRPTKRINKLNIVKIKDPV